MNPSNFDDLDIDAMTGAEIMGLLGLIPYQLDDPIVMNRMTDVVRYLKNVPDKSFFVNRISIGKNIQDKLSHVWSYIQVLQQKEAVQGKLAGIETKLRGFGEKELAGQLSDIERSLSLDTVLEKDSAVQELSHMQEQVLAYEM